VTDEGVRVGDAAREMEGRGLVDVVDDLDAIMAAARTGRAIVALDGCAAGCQARWLDAQGVRSTSTLKLEPAGAGGPGTAAMPQRRARPLPPVAPPAHPNRTNSLDDYLLAVDALTAPVVACGAVVDAPTLAAHVAQILGVSRPAAGEMIGRLEKEGLVFRGERKEVLLTPSGRTAADVLLRRQRILEHFVVETLGYDLADCHEEARGLAPGFDETPSSGSGSRSKNPTAVPMDVRSTRRKRAGQPASSSRCRPHNRARPCTSTGSMKEIGNGSGRSATRASAPGPSSPTSRSTTRPNSCRSPATTDARRSASRSRAPCSCADQLKP
jgi:hypothetical protein